MPKLSSGVDALVLAVFAEPVRQVVEAYSAFDSLPREFDSAEELRGYFRDTQSLQNGFGFVFVTYADGEGVAVRETITLQSPGQCVRYTWGGWGLISLQVATSTPPSVTANSEKRALAWAASTQVNPDWQPPSAWNWKAVDRHVRRLKRALKSAA